MPEEADASVVIEPYDTAPAEEAPPPPAPNGSPPAEEDPATLKAELAALRAQAAESQRAADYWHGEASRRAAATPPARAAEPEAAAETDLLDLIATKGEKGLDDLLAKRGFVRREDMNAAINTRAQQVLEDQRLIQEYPWLNDDKSEAFLLTAQIWGTRYKALVDSGALPAHMAQRAAAEAAELQLMRDGKLKTPAQNAADAKAQKEQQRLARIRAQAGGGGGRAPAEAEESDDLTPEQRQIAVRLLSGDGVTEEQAVEKYKARAKRGVQMRGGLK